MKLLRVKGRGLASLSDEFDINLASPEIELRGLFMIAGPTGAGKSTILDAIALALFDCFPRIDGPSADKEIGLGAADRTERADASSAILTRGMGFGFAEVIFVGADRNSYRSRWEIHRARMRSTGALQASVMSLTRIDAAGGETSLGGTKTETLAAIQLALGLSYDQFTRTVMLAQNRFDAFLTADGKARADLLEKITGEDVYARLSRRVFQVSGEKRAAMARLQDLAGQIVLLEEHQLVRLDAEQDSLALTIKNLSAEDALFTSAATWWDTDVRLTTALATARTQMTECEAALSALSDAREELHRTKVALGHAGTLNALDDARARLAAVETACAETASVFASRASDASVFSTSWAAARDDAAQHEGICNGLEPLWAKAIEFDQQIVHTAKVAAEAEEKARQKSPLAKGDAEKFDRLTIAKASCAAEIKAATEDVDAFADASCLLDRLAESKALFGKCSDGRGAASRIKDELDAARSAVAEAEGTAARCQDECAAIDTALHVLSEQIRPLADQIERGDLASIRSHLARVSTLQLGLVDLRAIADQMQTALGRLNAAESSAALAEAKKSEAAAALAQFDRDAPVLIARIDEARSAMRLFEAALSDEAEQLRSGLLDGGPCPVCGSRDHPRHDPDLAEKSSAHQSRIKELTLQKSNLDLAFAEAQALANSTSRALNESNEINQREAATIVRLREEWARKLSLLTKEGCNSGLEGASADDQNLLMLLSGLLSSAQERASELTKQSKALDAISTQISSLAKSQESARERKQKAETAHKDAIRAAGDKKTAAAGLDSQLQAQMNAVGECETDLTSLLAPMDIDIDRLKSDLDGIFSICLERADALSSGRHRLAEASQRSTALDPEIASAFTSANISGNEARAAEAHAATVTHTLALLRDQRLSLLGGESTTDHRSRHETALKRAVEAAEVERVKSNQADIALATARANAQAAETSRKQLVEDRDRATEVLASALGPLAWSEETLRNLLAKGQTWVAATEASLRTAEDNLTGAKRMVDDAEQTFETHHANGGMPKQLPEEIAVALHGIATRRDAANQRLGEIGLGLARDREARSTHAAYVDQIVTTQSTCVTWDAVNHAIGSSDGTKFRRFAQGHTFGVLLELANDQLRLLAPRYRLSRAPGDDLSLQVIDQDMGEEVRGVRSLSGGERFLVSLALALSLSKLAARKQLIETLFIDEGFGALDAGSLDLAMEGLEAIQSQGRTIGVISHVEAMKDRIPTQILVEKHGSGRSRIRLLLSA
jgi:exonuclease SbcC